MSNSVGLACAFISLFVLMGPQNERFAKYKPVEAYEIRPGVLMMPSYSGDGQVCEVGIQKRNYSPEIIRLDSSLSREEIDQIFEELAPANERGPKPTDRLQADLFVRAGPSLTEHIDFENVSIDISSETVSGAKNRKVTIDNIAAVVKWKNRKCQ
jgi:hypothetical protein